MADDWAQLAEDYQDDQNILIGQVNCVKQDVNNALCKEFGVTGYPTLMYGEVGHLVVYKGERKLGDLREVVEDYLEEGPLCGVTHPHLCDADKKHAIEELMHKGFSKLDKEIKLYEATVRKIDQNKTETLTEFKRKYQKALKEKNQRKQELEESFNLALMKEILKTKTDNNKDEDKGGQIVDGMFIWN